MTERKGSGWVNPKPAKVGQISTGVDMRGIGVLMPMHHADGRRLLLHFRWANRTKETQ